MGVVMQLAAMKAGSKDLKVTMKTLKIDDVDVSIASVSWSCVDAKHVIHE